MPDGSLPKGTMLHNPDNFYLVALIDPDTSLVREYAVMLFPYLPDNGKISSGGRTYIMGILTWLYSPSRAQTQRMMYDLLCSPEYAWVLPKLAKDQQQQVLEHSERKKLVHREVMS